MAGGSASALSLSRPAQASLTLRPIGSLSRPKATFVTRLQPCRLPSRAARQLPDQSTILRVESSSTDDSRLRGARPTADIFYSDRKVIRSMQLLQERFGCSSTETAGDAFRRHTSMVIERYLCGQVRHSRNLIGGSGVFASRVVICYLVTVMPAKEWRLAAGRSMSKSTANQSRQMRRSRKCRDE